MGTENNSKSKLNLQTYNNDLSNHNPQEQPNHFKDQGAYGADRSKLYTSETGEVHVIHDSVKKSGKKRAPFFILLVLLLIVLAIVWLPVGKGSDAPLDKIYASGSYYVILRQDGSVYVPEDIFTEDVFNELNSWDNITDIAIYHDQVLGLKSNGTVVFAGIKKEYENIIESWKNIVAIDNSDSNYYGLRSDGTVYGAGLFEDYVGETHQWTNIKQIDAAACDAGCSVIGLNNNGKIVGPYRDWSGPNGDVVYITNGAWINLGLKSDGTVICSGIDKEILSEEVSQWTDVIQVCGGDTSAYALKSDGTVLCAGYHDSKAILSGWENISALYRIQSNDFIAGIQRDGTVRCAYVPGFDEPYSEFILDAGEPIKQVAYIDNYEEPQVIGLTKSGALFIQSLK